MQGKRVVGGHRAACRGDIMLVRSSLVASHLENQPCVGGTDVLLYTHGAEQVQQPGRAGTRAAM